MRRGIDRTPAERNQKGNRGRSSASKKEVDDAQQALAPLLSRANDSQQGSNCSNRSNGFAPDDSPPAMDRTSAGAQQGKARDNKARAGGKAAGCERSVGGPAKIGDGTYGGGYTTRILAADVSAAYDNFDTGNNTPRGGPPVQPDHSPIPPQRAYDDSMRALNQLRQAVRRP